MAIKNKSILKTYFQAGIRPTQQNFADLIDSFTHISAAPAGMFFPAASSITTEDVGKLVILKEGKAQLPEFEPPVAAAPKVIHYQLNIDSSVSFAPDVLTVSFLSNPVDGDSLFLTGWPSVVFKDTPSDNRHVQIGSTIDATIDNFISNIELFNVSYELASPSSGVLTITRKTTGRYGYFSFKEDLFEATVSAPYAELSSNFVSIENRLGTVLVPFLFLHGLNLFEEPIYEAFGTFYQINSSFTRILQEDAYGICHFPDSLSEIKDGILDFLQNHPSVESAMWLDNILSVTTYEDFPLEIQMESSNLPYWNNALSDGTIANEGSPYIPSYCNYPLLGLVKSVRNNQVEIHTDPICTFRSSFDEEVNWTSLMDINRVWVLNPENPGYLRPASSNEINAIEDLFNIAAPGYIFSLEHTIAANATFTGAFSTELFALQVLYMIIQSSEED